MVVNVSLDSDETDIQIQCATFQGIFRKTGSQETQIPCKYFSHFLTWTKIVMPLTLLKEELTPKLIVSCFPLSLWSSVDTQEGERKQNGTQDSVIADPQAIHAYKLVWFQEGDLPSKYPCGVAFAFTNEEFLRGQVGRWISLSFHIFLKKSFVFNWIFLLLLLLVFV